MFAIIKKSYTYLRLPIQEFFQKINVIWWIFYYHEVRVNSKEGSGVLFMGMGHPWPECQKICLNKKSLFPFFTQEIFFLYFFLGEKFLFLEETRF